MTLFHSVERRFLPLVIVLGAGESSHAAITYVDPPDIVIPFTFEGVYLDIESTAVNGSAASGSSAADSYTLSYTEPASGDWDVNFYFGGALIIHNTTFQPYREDELSNVSAIHTVGIGTTIDGNPIDIDPGPSINLSSPLTAANFGGSGTTTGGGLDGSQSPTHMGSAADQFASGGGSNGYIAFVLNPGGSELFGWMQVTLSDNGGTGLIHDWAYSDTQIQVGQVPEPASVAVAMLGTLGLLRRQRPPSSSSRTSS